MELSPQQDWGLELLHAHLWTQESQWNPNWRLSCKCIKAQKVQNIFKHYLKTPNQQTPKKPTTPLYENLLDVTILLS